MKLLTFSRDDRPGLRLGALSDEQHVIDITSAAERNESARAPRLTTMLDIIEAGALGLRLVTQLISASARDDRLGLQSVRLHAPIPRPRRSVFCVGRNYVEHFEEGERVRKSGQTMHANPAFFTKATRSVIGPTDTIPFNPSVSEMLDWETELAVIIGKEGRDISEADARAHVFGYTVLNDISARDVQRRHGGQYMKGKSLDGTCPMGPWIATADEIDPYNLALITRVNGTVKQNSNTSRMYFKIERLIQELSLGMTLEPGDILATGTPAGVGWPRNPPEFLHPGDVVESELSGIGCLRNEVRAGYQ